MMELYKKKHRKGLELEALSYDDSSQSIMLCKGVHIISKVHNEDIGLGGGNNEKPNLQVLSKASHLIKTSNELKWCGASEA